MKLYKFHIHQRGPGVIGERMTIARVFPAVAGDFVRPANSSSRQHHRFGAEEVKSPAFAIVSKCASNPFAILEQGDDGVLHENIQAEMDSMVLKRADHLQASAVADVRQPWITMSAEIPLQNATVGCAVKERTPGFQFADARRGLFRM